MLKTGTALVRNYYILTYLCYFLTKALKVFPCNIFYLLVISLSLSKVSWYTKVILAPLKKTYPFNKVVIGQRFQGKLEDASGPLIVDLQKSLEFKVKSKIGLFRLFKSAHDTY